MKKTTSIPDLALHGAPVSYSNRSSIKSKSRPATGHSHFSIPLISSKQRDYEMMTTLSGRKQTFGSLKARSQSGYDLSQVGRITSQPFDIEPRTNKSFQLRAEQILKQKINKLKADAQTIHRPKKRQSVPSIHKASRGELRSAADHSENMMPSSGTSAFQFMHNNEKSNGYSSSMTSAHSSVFLPSNASSSSLYFSKNTIGAAVSHRAQSFNRKMAGNVYDFVTSPVHLDLDQSAGSQNSHTYYDEDSMSHKGVPPASSLINPSELQPNINREAFRLRLESLDSSCHEKYDPTLKKQISPISRHANAESVETLNAFFSDGKVNLQSPIADNSIKLMQEANQQLITLAQVPILQQTSEQRDEENAARTLQSSYKQFLVKKKQREQEDKAAVIIQREYRSYAKRKADELQRESAARRIQTEYAKFKERQQQNAQNHSNHSSHVYTSDPADSTELETSAEIEQFFSQTKPRTPVMKQMCESVRSDYSEQESSRLPQTAVDVIGDNMQNEKASSIVESEFSHFSKLEAGRARVSSSSNGSRHKSVDETSFVNAEIVSNAPSMGRDIDEHYRNIHFKSADYASSSPMEIVEASSINSSVRDAPKSSPVSSKSSMSLRKNSTKKTSDASERHKIENKNTANPNGIALPQISNRDRNLTGNGINFDLVQNYLDQLSQADNDRLSKVSSARSGISDRTLIDDKARSERESVFHEALLAETISEKRILTDLCSKLLQQVTIFTAKIDKQERRFNGMLQKKAPVQFVCEQHRSAKSECSVIEAIAPAEKTSIGIQTEIAEDTSPTEARLINSIGSQTEESYQYQLAHWEGTEARHCSSMLSQYSENPIDSSRDWPPDSDLKEMVERITAEKTALEDELAEREIEIHTLKQEVTLVAEEQSQLSAHMTAQFSLRIQQLEHQVLTLTNAANYSSPGERQLNSHTVVKSTQ